ncbi:uncharacterized protein [Pleurodeles waltl]|uniref:uncharacterized protein isoform X1 n=1 Tax=Pleurodeles waltl TaxID=8319 RepID=UPI003709413C
MSLGGLRGALWCLALGLLCGGCSGTGGLAHKYQEASLDDIQRDMERAVQLLNRKSFLPWQREQINQMVPRLHLGMIELWLEFRRLQEDKESMWKRMNAMLSRSLSACQEVATEMSRMKSDMSSRFTQVEGVISGLISKVGNLEVNRPQDPYVAKFGDPHTPFRTAVNSRKGDSGLRNGESGSRRGNPASSRSAIAAPSHPPNNAICPARILHRVSNLTQILNGHTNLLVELYERVSSLEDMGRPTEGKGPWIPVLPEGSGEGN